MLNEIYYKEIRIGGRGYRNNVMLLVATAAGVWWT